jgi:hypothetical protein
MQGKSVRTFSAGPSLLHSTAKTWQNLHRFEFKLTRVGSDTAASALKAISLHIYQRVCLLAKQAPPGQVPVSLNDAGHALMLRS